MPDREVWVTGLGIISSLGFGVKQFSHNLYHGIDKTTQIDIPDSTKLKRKHAAIITDDLPYVSKWGKYGKGIQMALLATQEALDDAGLGTALKIDNAGICMGTMLGQIPDFQNNYYQTLKMKDAEVSIDAMLQFPMDFLVDVLAKEFQVSGIRNVVSSVCVSSAIAIGTGYKWIQRGRADIVICGGAEAFSLLGHQLMSCLGIISKDSTKPFDENSDGFLLGEGAGIVILESKEHAMRRRARPYCSIEGYGNVCDAYDMSHPVENGAGLQNAILKAIKETKEPVNHIGFINAHGVGTKTSDEAEIYALKSVFGETIGQIPIYSIKGAIGHTSGAAGVMNIISAVLVMQNGCLPPTVNYSRNDKFKGVKITKDLEVTHSKKCISISVGFGGLNTCIVLKRDQEWVK